MSHNLEQFQGIPFAIASLFDTAPLLLPLLIVLGAFTVVGELFKSERSRKRRQNRKIYYNNVYLKSDAWQRKRHVVFKRDGGRCVHCGAKATQVHHKRYARKNIGKEPIEWLSSVCTNCHKNLHH